MRQCARPRSDVGIDLADILSGQIIGERTRVATGVVLQRGGQHLSKRRLGQIEPFDVIRQRSQVAGGAFTSALIGAKFQGISDHLFQLRGSWRRGRRRVHRDRITDIRRDATGVNHLAREAGGRAGSRAVAGVTASFLILIPLRPGISSWVIRTMATPSRRGSPPPGRYPSGPLSMPFLWVYLCDRYAPVRLCGLVGRYQGQV
jgi:hypothetical protein